ncbi:MAG: GDSL-type esterase/lipase family protein [Rhizobacter sp.]
MKPPRRTPLLLITGGAVLLALSGCAAWRIAESAELARRSEPLQQAPSDATVTLLIVGDSTAVGTGASSAQHSVAGLLAHDHPRLRIDNRARDGAKFSDLLDQLGTLGPGDRYDLVLVQAGGNDVIRLRDFDAMRSDIDQVTARAREHSERVIVMPAGNVGNAPFFFPPLSWWMTHRARDLHGLVRTAAAQHGAVYVNLFHERDDDPFVRRPELNASDGLHPSDAGYRVWFDQLMAQADLAGILVAARGP